MTLAKREYEIKVFSGNVHSVEVVSGFPVGKYLAVRKTKLNKFSHKIEWVVDHIPTGFKFGGFKTRKTAVAVAMDVVVRVVADDLQSDNISKIIKAMGGARAGSWLRQIASNGEFIPFATEKN